MELYLHKYFKSTGKVIGPNYYKSIPEDAEFGDLYFKNNKNISKSEYESAYDNFKKSQLPKTEFAVVFEPEQIHILGSKQDIENFANFVSYENSSYSKIGSVQQFRDYIMSKNFAAIEEFLVVNNKIGRKC